MTRHGVYSVCAEWGGLWDGIVFILRLSAESKLIKYIIP